MGWSSLSRFKAFIQKLILQYIDDPSQPLWFGLLLILSLFLSQLLRNLFFGMAYVINLHTGEEPREERIRQKMRVIL